MFSVVTSLLVVESITRQWNIDISFFYLLFFQRRWTWSQIKRYMKQHLFWLLKCLLCMLNYYKGVKKPDRPMSKIFIHNIVTLIQVLQRQTTYWAIWKENVWPNWWKFILETINAQILENVHRNFGQELIRKRWYLFGLDVDICWHNKNKRTKSAEIVWRIERNVFFQ